MNTNHEYIFINLNVLRTLKNFEEFPTKITCLYWYGEDYFVNSEASLADQFGADWKEHLNEMDGPDLVGSLPIEIEPIQFKHAIKWVFGLPMIVLPYSDETRAKLEAWTKEHEYKGDEEYENVWQLLDL